LGGGAAGAEASPRGTGRSPDSGTPHHGGTAVSAALLWKYIEERERIRLRREAGKPWPWTDDPILREFKFTNVRRLHDRTTQAFLAIYQAHKKAPARVALYNCGVHRFFGTAEFADTAGWQAKYDFDALARAVKECPRPYTGAYMVRADGNRPKVDAIAGYLSGLWEQAPAIVAAIQKERRWEAGYRVLWEVRGFGGNGFMAKEVLQDYLLWLPFEVKDAGTWTPVGPGARRGLNRLAGRRTGDLGLREEMHVREIRELLEQIQPKWRRAFPKADPLAAHDIQFCLCELDKYLRTKNGEGSPRSKYRPPPAP
jgi:hypothetical protein